LRMHAQQCILMHWFLSLDGLCSSPGRSWACAVCCPCLAVFFRSDRLLACRLASLFRSAHTALCYKVRMFAPCTVCAMRTQLALPDAGVVELLLTGICPFIMTLLSHSSGIMMHSSALTKFVCILFCFSHLPHKPCCCGLGVAGALEMIAFDVLKRLISAVCACVRMCMCLRVCVCACMHDVLCPQAWSFVSPSAHRHR
jgi:hypothetical protein